MPTSKIVIRGAREHNLKNIDVELPRNRFIVITGVSGSGKSTLAFDILYAEGQRRYVESLSAYARQFLELMDKPDVEYIEGLSPAIAIEQRSASRNPRSTVATSTEIYDYLRVLFARVGTPYCYRCGRAISSLSVPQMVDQVMGLAEGSRITVLAPLVVDRKGEHHKLLEHLRQEGFSRVRLNGDILELEELPPLDKNRRNTIEAVVDRLVIKPDLGARLTDSLELALKLGDGLVRILVQGGEELLFSERFACDHCGVSLPELTPRLFSFNSPQGACPGLQRPGHQNGHRPRPGGSQPLAEPPGGGGAALGAAPLSAPPAYAGGPGAALPLLHSHPFPGTGPRSPGGHSLRLPGSPSQLLP